MPKAEPYAFRPLAATDLPLLAKWLESRHVRRWWGDPAEALTSMEEHIDAASVSCFMVTLNGKDFAFIQAADLDDEDDEALAGQPKGTYGIDQFIGIEELAGKGHGPAFMIGFCDMLFAKARSGSSSIRILTMHSQSEPIPRRAFKDLAKQRLITAGRC